jgi:cytochrome c556
MILPTIASTQAPRPPRPTLEPIAETKLLMEGLAHPNFKAVDRILKEEPADVEAWQLARGQSLLIAETANLLMLRPPKSTQAEQAWMTRAMDLRDKGSTLARAVAARDIAKGRTALLDVSASCNKCHETFRVEVQIKPTDREK